ncbi:MAG: adenine nucleotide alpha hydrolase [Proteobacteria bacterium]|nr:adenine nucleotide alpha hydrolase [Pseudomonadota bacterium]
MSWSSGKDSAWAVQALRQRPDLELVGLFTTIDPEQARVPMHAVRHALVEAQASALGLPLTPVPLASGAANESYEEAMRGLLRQARAVDVSAIAFGDLFLEEVRRYREERMGGTGLELLFPLWGRPPRELAEEMIDAGLRARIVCVDTEQAPVELLGREFDRALLASLPATADPCGENGEFHTFAYAGPPFARPVGIRSLGRSLSERFATLDLEPESLRLA